MADIGNDIGLAASILTQGGLVAIPTETVYGLAANAFNEQAVLNVFKVKNRPSFDPLICHIAHLDQLKSLTVDIPVAANVLMDNFWPGPLTLVLNKSEKISNLVSSGLDTAAFRMPRHPLTRELLFSLDFPLVAPSANPFGYVSPTTAEHVDQQLGDQIDYILDGGPCKIGLESTIVSFNEKQPTILRLGGLSVEAIESKIGEVQATLHSSSNPKAPGMLHSHYAPRVPVEVGDIDLILKSDKNHKIGILSYNKKYPDYTNFVLTQTGDVNEAAKRFFAGLRWLDEQNIDKIITEYAPDVGLGRAINDRLNRASAQ